MMKDKIKKIHLTGIAGVAMSALAGLLIEAGYDVTGSDIDIYPPVSNLLNELKIHVYKGYHQDNIIDSNPNLVIVGNAVSRGNDEIEYVMNNKIPYMSMANALYYFFLKDKDVIAIAGTHGKTTTTSLLSFILYKANCDPSFLIGGIPKKYPKNYRLGKGKYFVIEADEYDSAFFEKFPKFILYKPQHLILTSLEYDHADIYKNYGEVETWFKRLINLIPQNGNIVYNHDDENLRNIINKSFSNVCGFSDNNANCIFNYNLQDSSLKVKFDDFDIELHPKIIGKYNSQNITAALVMAKLLGVEKSKIIEAINEFEGVKRRQEILYEDDNVIIIEDFAHHPTAIYNIIKEIKMKYNYYLFAIYEPRSATSRRNVFEDKLPDSFKYADNICFKNLYKPEKIPKNERLNIDKVVYNLKNNGKITNIFNDVNQIVNYVFEQTKNINKKSIILIMSNGAFDNIYTLMINKFKKDKC